MFKDASKSTYTHTHTVTAYTLIWHFAILSRFEISCKIERVAAGYDGDSWLFLCASGDRADRVDPGS